MFAWIIECGPHSSLSGLCSSEERAREMVAECLPNPNVTARIIERQCDTCVGTARVRHRAEYVPCGACHERGWMYKIYLPRGEP
jgi:hypothetical protein